MKTMDLTAGRLISLLGPGPLTWFLNLSCEHTYNTKCRLL